MNGSIHTTPPMAWSVNDLRWPISVAALGCCFVASYWGGSYVWRANKPSRHEQHNLEGGMFVLDPPRPCGATCVALVSRLYGKSTAIDDIVDLVQPDPLGRSSMDELVVALEEVGFPVAAVSAPAKVLCKVRTSMILHCQESPFVVAVAGSGGEFLVLDPPRAPATMSLKSITTSYSGRAIITGEDESGLAISLASLGL